MKEKLLAMVLAMMLLGTCSAQVAKGEPTPTPPPVDTLTEVVAPPQEIQAVLDLAYAEWETLAGKTLARVNKYTEWRGKGVGFGWCGGFVTWCMLQCEIPMAALSDIEEAPVEGVFHVMEASVGKLLRGYQKMGRATMVPQPGFLLVYGKSYNKTIHVGLVYDVESLGDGKYRITTIDGNMSNRVKMYVHDYDLYAENIEKNLTVVPEEERTQEETSYFNYRMQENTWYVNRFLMPWIPEAYAALVTATPEATESPAPTLTPAPVVAETPVPTVAPPEATETIVPATAAPVTATPIPLPTDYSLFD